MQRVEAVNKSQEDAIAERIIKRAEIAKLTRQLKSKLFKAGRKVRESQGKAVPIRDNKSAPGEQTKHRATEYPITPVKRRAEGKQLGSDDYDEDEEFSSSSPVKRMHGGNLPSSPFYVTGASPSTQKSAASLLQTPQSLASSQLRGQGNARQVPQQPPKTPTARTATLDGGALAKTPSPNKPNKLTVPNGHRHQSSNATISTTTSVPGAASLLETPKRRTPYISDNTEGADLLLYLSNSPARTTKESKDYNACLNLPQTPKAGTAIQFAATGTTPSFGLDSTPPRGGVLPLTFSTPSGLASNSAVLQTLLGTPGTSMGKFHAPATPNNKLPGKPNNKTPGFSMSDYVNIFTPSPRYSKTPDVHTFAKPSTALNFSKDKDERGEI